MALFVVFVLTSYDSKHYSVDKVEKKDEIHNAYKKINENFYYRKIHRRTKDVKYYAIKYENIHEFINNIMRMKEIEKTLELTEIIMNLKYIGIDITQFKEELAI